MMYSFSAAMEKKGSSDDQIIDGRSMLMLRRHVQETIGTVSLASQG